MRISMPLAGMDPTRKVDADGRDQAADRTFRMLSEGKRKPQLRLEVDEILKYYANIRDKQK